VVSFRAAGWDARRVVADNLGYWFGLVYVPIAVGIGTVLNRIKLIEGRLEHEAIIVFAMCAVAIILWRALSSRKATRSASES
jgi:hypothetical protein